MSFSKKVAFHTLGCKVNQYETESIKNQLIKRGYEEVPFEDKSDIYIINSCTVTSIADRKTRNMLRRAKKINPEAKVIVTGCYAQLESATVAKIEGVDLVLGSNEKADLVQYLSDAWNKVGTDPHGTEPQGEYHSVKTKDIKSFQASCSRGNRTRYFLKVQDGCNYFCTYCTIPYARGFSRNPSIASLVQQAKDAAQEGGKEIVLTGVNIGDFGETTGESFLDLVRALDKVEGIQRYRISSLEPDLIDDELIEYCAHSRAFMPHFHIPLQSGSDEVLKLMHRRYDTSLFTHKINLIKEKMPDAFIGVDVMVGSRGEKPEYFEECYNFLDALPVTQLHVFPYSERPGTSALSIPYVVEDREKKHRAHRLLKLSDEKTRAFYAAHIGQEADVLFEKAARGKAMHGFTDNYIRVELSPSQAKEEYDNQIIRVRLGGFNFDQSSLKAELL